MTVLLDRALPTTRRSHSIATDKQVAFVSDRDEFSAEKPRYAAYHAVVGKGGSAPRGRGRSVRARTQPSPIASSASPATAVRSCSAPRRCCPDTIPADSLADQVAGGSSGTTSIRACSRSRNSRPDAIAPAPGWRCIALPRAPRGSSDTTALAASRSATTAAWR